MVAYEFRDKSGDCETTARYEAESVWELVNLLAKLRAPTPVPEYSEGDVEIGEAKYA